MNQKKIANLGLFAAVAIIFGYVESLIPFFAGIPGMKLGLANLAVLFILEKYTWKEAALVSAVRIVVIGFMFGNLFSILYSLAGAALENFCGKFFHIYIFVIQFSCFTHAAEPSFCKFKSVKNLFFCPLV